MILFIDIETVPQEKLLTDLPEQLQDLWRKKASHLHLSDEQEEDEQLAYQGRSGVFAEFAKVVCISIGYLNKKEHSFHVKSIANDDEKTLLQEFKDLVQQFGQKAQIRFCGHNIREFDLPFICRRMIIQEISLPDELQMTNKKPWEIEHIDTMELWKFGDYKRYTSLDLLAAVLGVESSKNDIDGSQVAGVYYEENDLPRIVEYCQRDVITTAKVYYRLTNQPIDFTTHFAI